VTTDYDWQGLWGRKASADSALSASGRGSTSITTFLHIVADVFDVLKPLPSDHVLDLGCGPGMFSVVMAPLVARVHAVDLAPEMVALAAANLEPYANATADGGSLTDTGQPLESFDKVLVYSVLQYLPSIEDAAAACRELARVMRPGAVGFLAANPDPYLRHKRVAQINANPNKEARKLERSLVDQILWISRAEAISMAADSGLEAFAREENRLTSQHDFMYGLVVHKPIAGT